MKSHRHTPFQLLSFVVSFGLLMSLLASPAAFAASPTLDGAQWIWHQGAGDAAGTWYFQKELAFPAGQKPKQAHVLITCDNLWTLYVNGDQAGQNDPGPDSWKRPQSVDVTKYLVIE